MSLIRAAHRVSQLLQSSNNSHGVSLTQRNILRCLSIDAGTGSKQPATGQSSSIDPFLQTHRGFVYGKLFGANRHTFKTDIINFFDGSNLTPDDIKVAYNRLFNPTAVLLRFPSMADYDVAVRSIYKRGRVLRLEKAEQAEWDPITPYNGKYVLLQGLSTETFPEDVHRFLDGCNYDSSSFEMFVRPTVRDALKMVIVRFPSQIEAMNAAISKNRRFINNKEVLVRVLQ